MTSPYAANPAAPTPQESMQTLKADISKLGETVQQLAIGEFDAVTGNIRGKSKEKLTAMQNYFNEKPTQSLLMAVGLGVIIGFIIRR